MNILSERSLKELLQATESESLEFKAARNALDRDTVAQYCCALANVGGGLLVLGISDERPRTIVGTNAYQEEALQEIKRFLISELGIRVDVEEYLDPAGRVLVFRAASRPKGVPIRYKGKYWIRYGQSLTHMTEDHLLDVFLETGQDFSANPCPKATLDDLDPVAIEAFRSRWIQKSGNQELKNLSPMQLLENADLLNDGQLTYASLILMGSYKGLVRHLAQAETIFEYRQDRYIIEYQARTEYRKGILLYLDELWNEINLRNTVEFYQVGFFKFEVKMFNELVVREAILNALVHRDYQSQSSVFVKQYPETLVITNPGGFMPGITPENILDKQAPRNRCLALAVQRCGLVERSGLGVDLMYQLLLSESKSLPSYEGSDPYEVRLTLEGNIQDKNFLTFVQKVTEELGTPLFAHDLLVLDLIRQDKKVTPDYKHILDKFLQKGLVEQVGGRGKHAHYILSKDYYSFIGEKGTYTRKKGLDRETSKELLLKHIRENSKTGSPLSELMQVLPYMAKSSIQLLLQELKEEKRIYLKGEKRGSRWYPASKADL